MSCAVLLNLLKIIERNKMIKRNRRVCPIEIAGHLDNIFRKWVHNPKTILREHIKQWYTEWINKQ